MGKQSGSGVVADPGGTFLGHPKGLYILFFTEMWERFSYYGMRALLILYMVDFFKWSQEEGSKIYKWYTSLVYLTPLLGGYMADRYLGNKAAIIIGAILMSIGHFLMAIEEIWVFYAALGFLIMGNGFFKPNMTVQVGRLYPQNDPRRDSAYTIFYMGINLGAFLAPYICGTLRKTPGLGYNWAFGAAGVGMILALLVYLFGLPWIKELPEGVVYQPPEGEADKDKRGAEKPAMTEEEAKTAPAVFRGFAKLAPAIFVMIGVFLLVGSPLLWWVKLVGPDNLISMEIAAGCAFFAAWILSKLSMAVRDRVLAIYVLSVFVVFFWGAFEQAGNAMNVWADQTTNRYLTATPPEPSVYPEPFVDATKLGIGAIIKQALSNLVAINPVLTTSFQSVNPLAIVVFAPVFAWLWVFLARRQVNLSIATKIATGVFIQGIAFSLLIWSVKYENGSSRTQLERLPAAVVAREEGKLHFFDVPNFGDDKALERYESGEPIKDHQPMIAHGGRLVLDEAQGVLHMRGVLNGNHRDRMLRATVPKSYVRAVWELTKESQAAKKAAKDRGEKEFLLEKKLDDVPPGFEVRYLNGLNPAHIRFDSDTGTFIVTKELADKEYKQILVAGSDPVFREALNDLFVQSAEFKVSSWWLFGFYVLCTLGELCLSPVGLSMVSKLAPRRFATMLMGMWLLTSFFGNFTAGLAGEKWEMIQPGTYFTYVTLAMVAASLVCYIIAAKVTAMMHGVK